MKKKLFNIGLLACLTCMLFTACSDDNDSNPTISTPSEFVLNTPAVADQPIDLANSKSLNLTCSQPNYGFPAAVRYTIQVALNSDMTDFQELSEAYTSASMSLDAETLASTLTSMEIAAGKTEADFPMTVPVYLRAKAEMITGNSKSVEGTEILSNVVSFNKVNLAYSLPPVTTPDNMYITGKFCGWSWDESKAITMTPVYGATNVFWAMVWIDSASGIKINSALALDGNELGYAGIKVGGDLASQISSSSDGNIVSTVDQWYLMIVTTSVSGRNIVYDVQFNKPEVWLMGPCIGDDSWSELFSGAMFTAPTTYDGDFVSPAFVNTLPGGNDGDGVRAYVKVPDYDWWKSEFIIYDGKIVYRGAGDDQKPRVAGSAGQKLYLNFSTGEGVIKQ